MTIKFSSGDEPPADLLADAEGMYRDAAADLFFARRRLREGTPDEVRAATGAVRDLKLAIELVMQERTRIEKLRRQVAGIVDGTGHALDFDAARAEIGRRLARLRDAGDGG